MTATIVQRRIATFCEDFIYRSALFDTSVFRSNPLLHQRLRDWSDAD
jgi:hypothetical protein